MPIQDLREFYGGNSFGSCGYPSRGMSERGSGSHGISYSAVVKSYNEYSLFDMGTDVGKLMKFGELASPM